VVIGDSFPEASLPPLHRSEKPTLRVESERRRFLVLDLTARIPNLKLDSTRLNLSRLQTTQI